MDQRAGEHCRAGALDGATATYRHRHGRHSVTEIEQQLFAAYEVRLNLDPSIGLGSAPPKFMTELHHYGSEMFGNPNALACSQ